MTDSDIKLFRTIIDRYRRRRPKDWEAWLTLKQQLRHNLKDEKFGTNDSDSMRHVANIPAELDTLLRNTAMMTLGRPDYLNKEFLEEFTIFKIVDKI